MYRVMYFNYGWRFLCMMRRYDEAEKLVTWCKQQEGSAERSFNVSPVVPFADCKEAIAALGRFSPH
jgi:hypothetical protein